MKFSEWCKQEFRGWSAVHFLFDAGLTAMLGVVLAEVGKFSTGSIVALCVLFCIVVACAIAMAVRHREVREAEKHRVRDNVGGHLRELAQRLDPSGSPASIREWSEVVVAAVESRLSRCLAVEFAALLRDIEKRSDAATMAAKAVDYLNSICDRLHYSDIRRLPVP